MKTKIAIGIPTTGTIKSKTAFCLMELMKLPYEFFPIFSYGSYISENKENIVNTARENECSHVFFVDHDIKFNPKIIEILLSQDKDIIGADYNYRFLPITPMVKLFPETREAPTETFKAAAISGGCMLVKMSVFEKLSKPYFPMEYSEGKVVCTEDVGFCEKARKEGFDVWCDPTLKVDHIGDYTY